jgi:uncharacterized membrane protein
MPSQSSSKESDFPKIWSILVEVVFAVAASAMSSLLYDLIESPSKVPSRAVWTVGCFVATLVTITVIMNYIYKSGHDEVGSKLKEQIRGAYSEALDGSLLNPGSE